jgi:hypothetical protein
MGKFINVDRKMTIDNLVEGTKDKLQNPYYKFNNTSSTIVTYYNIDPKASTVDEGTRNVYSNTGENGSLRFNKINNMFIFGVDIIKLNLSDTDYGIETDGAEGNAIILPNTITPYPGDYFKVNHTDKPYLFKVTAVDIDTLYHGANAYQIKYTFNRFNESDIESQINNEFTMIIDNVGTQMNPIIRSNDYNLIEDLEVVTTSLKKYYEELFWDNRVQTFIYPYQNKKNYDPYLIEFLIRNKLLTGSDKYIYVTHQTHLQRTFSIDYDRTVFRSIELGEKNNISNNVALSVLECDPNSILTARFDNYYTITYTKRITREIPIEIIPAGVVRKIRENNNDKYTISDPLAIYNILIEYMNNEEISIHTTLDIMNRLQYCENKELFYGIPIVLFILEDYIRGLLQTTI